MSPNLLKVRSLSSNVGIEVLDIDVSGEIDATTAAELRRMLYRHQLLLFRGLDLTVDAQVRVTGAFGNVLEPWDETHRHPSGAPLEIFRESPERPYRRPAEHWHTDGSFLAMPTDATFLHAVVVPDDGGHTKFANARAALAALPGETRDMVAGLRATHSFGREFGGLREKSRRVDAVAAAAERVRFPMVEHDLARRHPVCGERALYLNELCLDRIVGLAEDEGRELLASLYQHLLQPCFIYEHEWQVGDLLIWDNPSLLHRATAVGPGQRRLVHRTTAQYSRAER
jgi:taurine dioxygenase